MAKSRMKVEVEPKLSPEDRGCLTQYIRSLKLYRPSYVEHGCSFWYRGSQVKIIPGK